MFSEITHNEKRNESEREVLFFDRNVFIRFTFTLSPDSLRVSRLTERIERQEYTVKAVSLFVILENRATRG